MSKYEFFAHLLNPNFSTLRYAANRVSPTRRTAMAAV
jgi:hypothetical protein